MAVVPGTIKHVVVLMLENRSFDHVLGSLTPAIPGLLGLPPVAGVVPPLPDQPVFPNLRQDGTGVFPSFGARTIPLLTDAGHEPADVFEQVFPGGVPNADPAAVFPRNAGFVRSYEAVLARSGEVAPPNTIMAGYGVGELPILHWLAQQYLVCDRWYSSVPGPTWPNRFYAHCGTSRGLFPSPSLPHIIEGYGFRDTLPTLLGRAGKSWRIYYHDAPQSLGINNLRPHFFVGDAFATFDTFAHDVAAGTLPAYSFIEPLYSGTAANDGHPPHNLESADALVGYVYDTLGDPAVWDSTLLLIVWDEHGGTYDHLTPPDTSIWGGAVNPDSHDSVDPPFDFDRLGVRVPAIIVSSRVGAPGLDHRIFDHSSIPASVCKILGVPLGDQLGLRSAGANTFGDALSAGIRRFVPAPAAAAPPALPANWRPGISEFQRALLAVVEGARQWARHNQTHLDVVGPELLLPGVPPQFLATAPAQMVAESLQRISTITSEAEAADYLRATMTELRSSRRPRGGP